MTSIVVPAHNEGAVIGRCLDALLEDAAPGEFDVIVVANGCTDDTVQVAAKRAGVRVLDLEIPGKVAALNAGDEVALGYPRIYLDADIVMCSSGVRALCAAVTSPHTELAPKILASTACRKVDVSSSPLLVRSYFAINSRLPVFRNALFGRGVIVLSAEGRARFGKFPDVIADDLFVDSLFLPTEKREVESVSTTIASPRSTRDLVYRLARVRRGNMSMRRLQSGATDIRASHRGRTSWLFDVVLRSPTLIPAGVCYVFITIMAAILAQRQHGANVAWAHDESSREPAAERKSGDTANDPR